MYIMNRRQTKRRALGIAVAVFFVAGLGGMAWTAKDMLQPDTKISATPPAKVTHVLGSADASREFQAGPISLKLPPDWEAFTPPDARAGSYSWRNTKGNKGVRVLTMFVDAIPRDYAVNRVLVVQGEDNHLVQVGDVSENCSEFNSEGRTPRQGHGKTTARWLGAQFQCDSANYLRNVVGTTSKESPNSVKLTNPSGSHELFMVYTDADDAPEFDIFKSAVESVRL
jgi:hypothetical protein